MSWFNWKPQLEMMENVFIKYIPRHCLIILIVHDGERFSLNFTWPVCGQNLPFHFHVKFFRQEEIDP